MWRKILKTGKYLIPLAAFFFLGVAVYPDTTMNVVSEQIRSMLERVLVLVHTPTRAIVATTLLPYMIMRGIINGSLRSLSDATAIITRFSHWAVSTPKATDLSGVPLSFIILVSPLIEELTFRWGFFKLWKLLSSEGNKSDSDDSRSLSRWVIVSSLLFSAVHIGNHLPVSQFLVLMKLH